MQSNDLRALDPHVVPLEAINLIEASAGTGKSWTVTLLYLRLILEKGLTVDQILVVTFTDAATKELRDDIRNRLVDALIAFDEDDYQENNEYSQLISNSSNKDEAIRRLNRAKLSLDEAAIFTIHSFCQRALTENAFEAGLPFESELMDDDSQLMQQITDDFWRQKFSKAPPALLFKLQQKSITPDSLLKDIRLATGKPYLSVCGPVNDAIAPEKWSQLETLFELAIKTWKEECDEVTRLLSQPDLEKSGYRKACSDSRDFYLKEIGEISASGNIPSKIDSKLSWLGTKDKTLAKFEPIEHCFFEQWQEFLDCWKELDSRADDAINHLRIELLSYLNEKLPAEKRKLGVLSFDDLLLQLQSAVLKKDKEGELRLAKDLRYKYPVALIDEFQDTDPIQYDIFRTIYWNHESSTVFLVGDPKQAIYSFRGGDIHTYLNAKSNTSKENHYTLNKNWRSHPNLINAFNTLYQSGDNPFHDKGIQYVKIDAGNIVTDKFIAPDKRRPLRFWQVTQDDLSEKITAKQIRKNIAKAVAGDIAELLNASAQGEATIGVSPISGGDIAILIRSHSQGNLIKEALNAKGISSVQSNKDNIFNTHEATEIIRLLTAIIDPRREDNVRRALVTDLIGLSADDLMSFESDSNAWESRLLSMQSWNALWKKKGFLPMMRNLMITEQTHQHFMSYDDGERRLTNTLHLAEIIHHQSCKESMSIEEVLRWLMIQQQNSSMKESELRLESDEDLVKIVTIHKSKGLEYPIVYCPFLGISSKSFSDKIFTFYEGEQSYLELGSTDAAAHKAIKIEEEKAEDARLLYVALTRAKYHCTLPCVPDVISGTPDRSALGWLLTDGLSIQSGTSKAAKENNTGYFNSYREKLQSLSENNNINIDELPEFDESLRYNPVIEEQILNSESFTAQIKSQVQITSFSGLTANAHAETPDHDSSKTDESSRHTQNSPQKITIDEFPRGATAGSALHEIYENLDFTQAIHEQTEIISIALKKWGFDEEHETTAQMLMEHSLQAELFDNFSLQDLENNSRLNEMEFYLPLQQLQFDNLQQILYEHLPEDWQVVRDSVKTLRFEQVEGYLKGFIDLIFVHDGKYYVADYKSNSLSDYAPENLLTVMASSHYYLQYLLYSVALHRYLKKRIPNYSWDTHMGGSYYLFIRGMSPENSNNDYNNTKSIKTRGGVFYHKPSLALINALDSLFMESFL